MIWDNKAMDKESKNTNNDSSSSKKVGEFYIKYYRTFCLNPPSLSLYAINNGLYTRMDVFLYFTHLLSFPFSICFLWPNRNSVSKENITSIYSFVGITSFKSVWIQTIFLIPPLFIYRFVFPYQLHQCATFLFLFKAWWLKIYKLSFDLLPIFLTNETQI